MSPVIYILKFSFCTTHLFVYNNLLSYSSTRSVHNIISPTYVYALSVTNFQAKVNTFISVLERKVCQTIVVTLTTSNQMYT